MSAKKSTYAPKVENAQHPIVNPDGTSRTVTFSKRHGDTLIVSRGVIVNKHFRPVDKNAKEDRQAQLERPEEHVKTTRDLILLSEILHSDGWFGSKKEAKQAIVEAMEADVESPEDLDAKLQEERIAEICEDRTVEDLKDLLKEEGIAYHGRAKKETLAKKVLESGILEE